VEVIALDRKKAESKMEDDKSIRYVDLSMVDSRFLHLHLKDKAHIDGKMLDLIAKINYIIEERYKPLFLIDDRDYRERFNDILRTLEVADQYEKEMKEGLLIGVEKNEHNIITQEICRFRRFSDRGLLIDEAQSQITHYGK
jgi:hypothetical protein